MEMGASWSPYVGELTLSPNLEQARLPQRLSLPQAGQIYRKYFGQRADATLASWPEFNWEIYGGRRTIDTQHFLALAQRRAGVLPGVPSAPGATATA
jgi:hypothetical protein